VLVPPVLRDHGNAGTLIYANMPYADQNKAGAACDIQPHPNGNQADATINVASHEHIESVTDPYGTGWYDANGYEIADLCAWTFGSSCSRSGRTALRAAA